MKPHLHLVKDVFEYGYMYGPGSERTRILIGRHQVVASDPNPMPFFRLWSFRRRSR